MTARRHTLARSDNGASKKHQTNTTTGVAHRRHRAWKSRTHCREHLHVSLMHAGTPSHFKEEADKKTPLQSDLRSPELFITVSYLFS